MSKLKVNLTDEEIALINACETKCAKCGHLSIFHNVLGYRCDACEIIDQYCGEYDRIDVMTGQPVYTDI